MYAKAKKVSVSDYWAANSSLGFFYGDMHFQYLSDLEEAAELDDNSVPRWVWGAKLKEIYKPAAEDIWQEILQEMNTAYADPVPGSLELLDHAINEFYLTNKDKLVSYEIDYSTVVLLTA